MAPAKAFECGGGGGGGEYSQAGHVYCEHVMDVMNGSIHTERVLYE